MEHELMQTSIGLIGLGQMGQGLGRNLLQVGYRVTAYDIEVQTIEKLVQRGATAAASPRTVAESADIVITVLPDGPQVEAVILGPEGVLAGARPGTIVIDCSTIDPLVTQQVGVAVRQAGCRMVDAAMSGSPKLAAEGKLVFMVGATPEDYAAVRPVLEAISRDVVHCGEPGTGIAMKIVNNLLALTVFAADVEALILGAQAGLDIDLMLRVLSMTWADNFFLREYVPRQVRTGDHTAGFKMALAHKDLCNAHNLAARTGTPLFTLASARQLYSLATAQGKGNLSIGAIATVLEDLVGVHLAHD